MDWIKVVIDVYRFFRISWAFSATAKLEPHKRLGVDVRFRFGEPPTTASLKTSQNPLKTGSKGLWVSQICE